MEMQQSRAHLHLHEAGPGPLASAHFPEENPKGIDVHRLAEASGGQQLGRHVGDSPKRARADRLLRQHPAEPKVRHLHAPPATLSACFWFWRALRLWRTLSLLSR